MPTTLGFGESLMLDVAIPVQAKIVPASGTTGTITIPAGASAMRIGTLRFTENSTLAVAGVTQLTWSLNGNTMMSEGYYLPATASGQAGAAYYANFGAAGITFPVVPGELITWTLSVALAGGQIDVNLYFS